MLSARRTRGRRLPVCTGSVFGTMIALTSKRKESLMKHLLLLADGFEEIEALGTADILRRGGTDLTLCSINAGAEVTGAHGIRVTADTTLAETDPDAYGVIILPGGMTGTENLAADARVTALLRKADGEGRRIAAICAAPAIVLQGAGVIRGRNVTGYPAEMLIDRIRATYAGGEVCCDGTLITAAGPGSFKAFAAAILAADKGEACAARVLAEALMA